MADLLQRNCKIVVVVDLRNTAEIDNLIAL
jgi:hypothetical protein